MTRALVTGATGLVGSYIAARLLTDGWQVRALVRDPSSATWLADSGVELVRGELLDAAALDRAAAGADVIFHCAAFISTSTDWPSFQRANIDGTQSIVDCAAAVSARLVHISSVAVYGGASRYASAPTDESAPLAPLPEHAYYSRSKREGEAIVLGSHASKKLWATAVRPPLIYGVRDRQCVPRLARIMRSGFFPIFGGGRSIMSLVHASAVADGAVRAARTDAAGGRAYNLTNDFPVSVRDMLRYASAGLEARVRALPIALGLARPAFAALAAGSRIIGKEGLAEQLPDSLRAFSLDNPFSSERARRELGWAPAMRPEIGIPEAFTWYRSNHRNDAQSTPS